MTMRPRSEAETVQHLREWVHRRFGIWITHRTAKAALRAILGDAP